MFEKDTDNLLYTRENFSIEEKLYKNYISMRKILTNLKIFLAQNRISIFLIRLNFTNLTVI